MSHASQEMFLKDLSSQEYVQRVLHGGNAGYFTTDIDNVRSLVTYVSSNQLGWKFISVLPFSAVVADMDRIRNNTFLVGMVIFFLGIILSYFFARGTSFPIYNLKQKVMELIYSGNNAAGDIEFITTGVNEAAVKLHTLESMKKEKAVLEKETFMRNLLLDCKDSKSNSSDVKGNLSVDLERSIIVVIFKIDNFLELKNKSNIIDLNLLKFAIGNIACEILSAVYAVEAADTGEDHVTLLINTISEVQNTEEDTIRPFFIEIQKAVLEYFKLSLTVAVGCILNNVAGLNNSYKSIIKNFEYRMILGHQSIITYSYVMSVQGKEYVFPENMEKNMIEALKLCRKEQAEQIFFEIINHAIELGINALHSAIIRLVVAISNTAQTIKLYYNAVNLSNMDVNTLVRIVNQMETLNQITAFFEEYFQRIIEVLDEKRSTKMTMLVYNVKKYIESNYVDPNLSLKSMADLHHISTAYLGKLFKENVGESVSEYINEIRLKEALKLLSESSMPINDIIEKTGNTSTLFFRYFRKAFGITPNEYRKNMQKPSLN